MMKIDLTVFEQIGEEFHKRKNDFIILFISILIIIALLTITIFLISMVEAYGNYLEGDILPDTSPWSFI